MATITLEGPRDVWYGLGFHALAMGDEPWTIIVSGNGSVMERKLASHQPGTLPLGLQVLSFNHLKIIYIYICILYSTLRITSL